MKNFISHVSWSYFISWGGIHDHHRFTIVTKTPGGLYAQGTWVEIASYTTGVPRSDLIFFYKLVLGFYYLNENFMKTFLSSILMLIIPGWENMKLYRFSPIKNAKDFHKAINHIVSTSLQLGSVATKGKFTISSLTIFSHYQEEFETLKEILLSLGIPSNNNNGPRVKLHDPLIVGNNIITHVRVRQPDPYRMQVGCVDFDIDDYQNFKQKFLRGENHNIRLIIRENYEMIEFFDPSYDVLAYIVSDTTKI